MLIAEALTKIKDLEKERREVQEKLENEVFILPDIEVQPPTVESLIEQYQELTTQIAELKVRIIATNVTMEIEVSDIKEHTVKLSIMSAIKLMESYRNLEARYSKLLEVMGSKRARFYSQGGFGSEKTINLFPNFQPQTSIGLREEIKNLRSAVRRVEQAIIKANWNTPLL